MHEFVHLIDDKYDGLSLKKEFEEVLFHYQKLLRSLPKGTFPENGVYTLRYYLTPTEVFARSLEIYFTHFEKLNTDIIAQPDAPCYPQNKELYELIKKYWDKWLIKIGRECK